ncbi:unnamed protein product [Schistosoma turkestanicum]|nr:unnamed protein product [Schistosoma turkestanicum]
MADQFAYANMQQASQTGYPPFHYPTASDQNAQLLQGYALSQQGNPAAGVPGTMFGAQSAASYNFDQTAAYNQSSSIPVCQVDGSQVPMQPAGGFAYPNFSGSFNQYPGMGQGMPPGLSAVQAGFSTDMQQFGPLMANAFGQTMSANGAILEAIAHEQGLAGFNPVAFLQDPTGTNARGGLGSGRGSSQRGGYNKFGGSRSGSNLPSVTNPDGLREDTIFVSNLPQNIDHDVMKSQFGVVGKIKINSKSGMPMIWIFKEKGIPKGEALVTYEDPSCVQSAIQWFKEHEFLGRKIEVKQAINSQRPVIIPPGGGGLLGGNGNGPNNPAAALAVAAVAAAASGNTVASLMNNSAAAAASLAALTANNPQLAAHFDSKDYQGMGRGGSTASRGARGAITNGSSARPSVGSAQAGSREGDWSCPQCGNINFSWREQCNRCQSTRSGDGSSNPDTSSRNNINATGRGAQPPVAVMNSNSQQNAPGFGRGGAMNPNASANRGGRGGGPMRGSSVGTGRARPAPY